MGPIKFTKMNGLGNDFVVIDGSQTSVEPTKQCVQMLANRNSGIGCDQVLWLTPSDKPNIDFIYRIFNPDGHEVGQCGNGARCVGYYVKLFYPDVIFPVRLQTMTGVLLTVDQSHTERVFTATMGLPRAIDSLKDQPNALMHQHPVDLDQQHFSFYAVDVGNPHMVIFVSSLDDSLPIDRWGQALQHHHLFPAGVNVEFVEIVSPTELKLRVYERGAGETQACASGACAAVVAGILKGELSGDVQVSMLGGALQVSWPSPNEEITQSGAVELVFIGQWGFDSAVAQNKHLFRIES